ncbi:unnamed protein product [Symbiodinium microadriaticum]|nr:unnamed protein product [Symbiodinium microadriaticum]
MKVAGSQSVFCLDIWFLLGLGTSTFRRPAEHALRIFTATGPILASLRLTICTHADKVQIGFGATTGGVTTLELHPPAGLACQVLDAGHVTHELDNSTALVSELPLAGGETAPFDGDVQTLFLLDRNLDGFPDFVRGELGTSGEGSWLTSMGMTHCQYTFAAGQKMHAGQRVFFALQTLNPLEPMTQRLGKVSEVRCSTFGSRQLHQVACFSAS